MTRLRHISAWVLLASFAVGGTLGPAVHQVQHAVEQAAAAAESCHSDAVHNSEVALWTEPGSHADAPQCDICTRRLLVGSPAPAPDAGPFRAFTSRTVLPSGAVPAQTVTDLFIRGPPSRLGDRFVSPAALHG